jgi:hypothetical protein
VAVEMGHQSHFDVTLRPINKPGHYETPTGPTKQLPLDSSTSTFDSQQTFTLFLAVSRIAASEFDDS